jgi:membrane associated rhomboid family serine protease
MKKNFRTSFKLILGFISILWVVRITDFVLPIVDFNELGIKPRSIAGLPGILLSPILHTDFSHLAANTVPLVILLSLLVYSYPARQRNLAIISIVLLGSTLVWLFARQATHVGASGLIYGLVTFLIAGGYYARRVRTILIAFITLILYGGISFGALPFFTNDDVSWEGHLFGAIAGFLAAKGMKKNISTIDI